MSLSNMTPPWAPILMEIDEERVRQIEKHGDQSHLADGTGPTVDIVEDIGYFPGDMDANGELAICARERTDALANVPGRVTFAHILTEEWAEAMAEDDEAALRTELIQVAATAVQWVEAIDQRGGAA